MSNTNASNRTDRLNQLLGSLMMARANPIPLGMNIITPARTFLMVDCTSIKGDRCLLMLHPRVLGQCEASWHFWSEPADIDHGSDRELYDWLEQFRENPNSNVLPFIKP